MTAKDFDLLLTNRQRAVQAVLSAKAGEYASDADRLHNFKRAGELIHCHPAKALQGMLAKHLVSLFDIVDGLNRGCTPPAREVVSEKLGDAIAYLHLLEGLIEEATRQWEARP